VNELARLPVVVIGAGPVGLAAATGGTQPAPAPTRAQDEQAMATASALRRRATETSPRA